MRKNTSKFSIFSCSHILSGIACFFSLTMDLFGNVLSSQSGQRQIQTKQVLFIGDNRHR